MAGVVRAWVRAAAVGGVLLAAAAAAAQDAPALKVLRLPIRTDGPKSLDPVKGSTQYDNQACSQVYETLLQWKYLKRPLELEPLLLARMPEATDQPDGTRTWRFTLRRGVRFHDDPCFAGGKGREVVTDDVFYSWKRLADPQYEYENWWLVADTIAGFDRYKEEQRARVDSGAPFDYAAPVEGLRKLGDHEFEVVLTEPVQRFLYVLAQFQLSVVPREAVEAYGETFSRHPVGTGPFTVREEDWKPGAFLIMNRNPTYHEDYYPAELPADPREAARDRELGFDKAAGRRLPLVDRIENTFFVEDQPMWLTFDSGGIDFTQVPSENFKTAFVVRTRKLKQEYAERGIVGHEVLLLDFIFRGFNMLDPVVGGYDEKRRKLRQALSLAYDLESMNEAFYNGTCVVYDGPIPPTLDGHPEDGVGPVSYRGPDLERAERLLAEAGYPGGRGLPPLDYYSSRGGNQVQQMQRETQFLEAIGVKLNTKLVDFSEFIEAVNKNKAQMFGYAWGSDYPDAENNFALFYGPNRSPGSNSFNYDNPEFNSLYEKVRLMEPGPERTALYERMRDIVVEDAPFIGSLARRRYYAVHPWLLNFKPTEDFHNYYKYLDVDVGRRPRR